MHRGEDSAYYLKKGHRVVAFEAHPEHIRFCRRRFESEIASGQLEIVEGAVAGVSTPTVEFFVHSEVSVWGTINAEWATRNEVRGASSTIEVPVVDFAACLDRYGIPDYMKIDIEGADQVCLESLHGFEQRPRYLSLEAEQLDWRRLEDEFDMLGRLGYDRFAICQQCDIDNLEIAAHGVDGGTFIHQFESDASGPFGEDLTEPWVDRETALRRYRWIFRGYRLWRSPIMTTSPGKLTRRAVMKVLGRPVGGWYDTHATMSEGLR
jgi:FkbM family methyltransferase